LAVCAAAAGVILLGLANWHLFVAAERSHSGCVAHARLGAESMGAGSFAAARSVCSPR
jgi:hypothetical protein